MRQSWRDLLFAHWPVDPGAVRLPAGLELDTFEGRAWMTMTPHWIRVERVATMRELSIRTYVRGGGVYFTALWTDNPLAVRVARLLYKIDYDRAPISLVRDGDTVTFDSPFLRVRYGPAGPTRRPRDGLESWLVERHRLYVANKGNIFVCNVDDGPWQMANAAFKIEDSSFDLPALVGWCERHDVRLGKLERIA